MKAIICTRYGSPDVLQLQEIAKPAPKDNQILVRVYATSINYGDIIARNFKDISPRKFSMPFPLWIFAKIYFGFRKPRVTILGSEFSGEVESTGKEVKSFKVGDQIFGYVGQSMGTNAEYLCMPETGCVALKPAKMSYPEAVAAPYGAIMALYLLRKMNIRPGQKVLINGASGGIGSAAVQIAKNHFRAEVTGVCSTPRLEFVKAIGADRVIDYTKEDFTESGKTYDVIFDILGRSTFAKCKKTLSPNGRYLLASFKTGRILQMLWTSIIGGKRVVCAIAPGGVEDLISVKKLIEEGKIKSIIDRSFPLEQTAEAHRYVEEGNKKGSVVITVGLSNKN